MSGIGLRFVSCFALRRSGYSWNRNVLAWNAHGWNKGILDRKIKMWPFNRKKSDIPDVHVRAWNLMHYATDPDRNWEFASSFRKTEVPGSVLTCETTFIMGSMVMGIITERVKPPLVETCLASAEKAYAQCFEEDSKAPLPEEMREIYGERNLGEIAGGVLKAYGADGDLLHLMLSRFVSRIKGDPRMKTEILPLFEGRRRMLLEAFGE